MHITEGGQQTESWLNKKKKNRTKYVIIIIIFVLLTLTIIHILIRTRRKSLFTGELAMEHAEIDVNDPDFWKKVLPDLVTPDTMLERLADGSLMSNDEDDRDAIEKYMKDLNQMMEGK